MMCSMYCRPTQGVGAADWHGVARIVCCGTGAFSYCCFVASSVLHQRHDVFGHPKFSMAGLPERHPLCSGRLQYLAILHSHHPNGCTRDIVCIATISFSAATLGCRRRFFCCQAWALSITFTKLNPQTLQPPDLAQLHASITSLQ